MGITTQFQPYRTEVQSVALGNPTTFTTTIVHNYNTGLIVRLFMPYKDGLQNMVGQLFPITVTGPTTFTVPYNSGIYEAAYSADTAFIPQQAQIIPVAEQNQFLNSSVDNVA